MKGFKEYIHESVNSGGLEAEMKVFDVLKKIKIKGFNLGTKPTAGFSSVGSGDLESSLDGKPFNIEIKSSIDDQMGGSSFRYDFDSKQFTPAKEFNPDDLELMLKVIKNKTKDIDNYILAAKKLPPVSFHKEINGVPLKISKEAREILKKKGLLKAINTIVKSDISFIERHYNKKNVFYIQVNGAGLFYLGKDILKLGVPRLKGEVNIEFRLGFAGGGKPFPTDPPTEARIAGLRVQGRVKTKNKSPFSLDDINSVKNLFKDRI